MEILAYTPYIDWQASGTVRLGHGEGYQQGDALRASIEGDLESDINATSVSSTDLCMGVKVVIARHARAELSLAE